MSWYLQVLKKYAEFSGRACRKEFWMFNLVNLIVIAALSLVDGVGSAVYLRAVVGIWPPGDLGLLATIFYLAVLMPTIAVSVRRMHDTNHNGWWFLLTGVNLVLALREGQRGENRFGPDPKAQRNRPPLVGTRVALSRSAA